MSFLRPALRPAFRAQCLRPTTALFSTTTPRAILPAGPQVVQGTVNDASPVPDPHPSEGSYHWTFERGLALGLVPLMMVPFAAGSVHPITDAALASVTILHSHIGFQASIVDYVPRSKYPKSYKGLKYLLNGVTVVVLYGLYEFETNDIGVTAAVKKVWKA